MLKTAVRAQAALALEGDADAAADGLPAVLGRIAPERFVALQWITLNCSRITLSRYQFTPPVAAQPSPAVGTPE